MNQIKEQVVVLQILVWHLMQRNYISTYAVLTPLFSILFVIFNINLSTSLFGYPVHLGTKENSINSHWTLEL